MVGVSSGSIRVSVVVKLDVWVEGSGEIWGVFYRRVIEPISSLTSNMEYSDHDEKLFDSAT